MQHSDNAPASQPAQLAVAPRWRALVSQAGVGALLGLLFFAWLAGFQIVAPSHITWLLDSPDPTTHYLGWAFFRHDGWHVPPGLNPTYGMATGSSIVYSDSIPLMALLLKPFSPWLGEPFQYTGLWLLLCFILHGALAVLLCGRLLQRLLPQLLAGSLFLLAFIFLKRLDGHYALCAQWPILWALYLCLAPSTAPGRMRVVWAPLIALAALLHLYLAVLVLTIWSADLLRRYLADRHTWRPAGREIALVLTTLLCSMWLAGYFCLGFSETRTPNSAGAYSMNLLSPIDPRGFSLLLPALPLQRPGQIEGAAYLGLGILTMVVITLVVLPSRPRCQPAGTSLVWTPLLIACGLLLLFAISPIITCGSTRLLALPNYWGGISEVLRATGRMSWPAVYVLTLLLLTALATRLSPRLLVITLAAILLIQFLDLAPMLHATRLHFRAAGVPVRSLSDPFWAGASQQYRRVVLVPSDAPDTDWYPLAFFAAEHAMAINHGYFARMDWNRKEAANQRNLQDLSQGKLEPDSVYILCTPQAIEAARSAPPSGARVLCLDGYTVLIP